MGCCSGSNFLFYVCFPSPVCCLGSEPIGTENSKPHLTACC
ncbi:hypothetical protein R5R35_013360 [Gryllus longicercus]|uniref:Uncharacterized protein n=1 Tax=Gryllus longicercus TaxID=2509291 RepID=A0AAN9W2U2_9ORTH